VAQGHQQQRREPQHAGFKSSQLQFANLFYANGDSKDTFSKGSIGLGLNTLSPRSISAGGVQADRGSLDLAIDGEGLFVVRDDAGVLRYTRAGQFEFNSDGILVNRSDGSPRHGDGLHGPAHRDPPRRAAQQRGEGDSNVTFRGNLSNDGTTHVLGSVQVIDALGGQHNLSVTFTNGSPANPGQWAVKVADGTTTVATGNINFVNGLPDPATSTMSFTYSPAGVAAVPLNFDFSTDVTSFAAGRRRPSR
jgi:flagellar hook protein FlgE